MWFVVQVRTGSESKICAQCSSIVSTEVIERCFVPYFEEKRKLRDEWTMQKRVLFPGYVFVITEQPQKLPDELRKITSLTNILKVGDEIVPITEEEEKFLKRLGLDDKEILEMSEGIIEGETITITSGPLEGMEAMIKKINRHKRRAIISTQMFGRLQDIEVGLEIVSKQI